MRRVPSGSFDRLSSFVGLWQAWELHRRGKRRRPSIAAFDVVADARLLELAGDLQTGNYRPGPYRQKIVRDPKLRLVSAPALRDRVVHQALVTELAPHFECSYIYDSYACRPSRGPHRAVLRYLGWVRTYRYRLRLDIRQYFQSIDHATLISIRAHRVHDHKTLALLGQLVAHGGSVYETPLAHRVVGAAHHGRGVPVGSCLSQWAANLYLHGLDELVKRELKIRGYLRYMDDSVLFANDRDTLVAARDLIASWLRQARGLDLNPKYGGIESTKVPSCFLGYRVSRAGLAPSRKLRRRLRANVQRAAKRGPDALVRTIRSYRGLLAGPV